jgi:NAD(P)-dependent dehydrogenase (short-subunit alcohol dehydrogenase family)
MSEFEDKVVIVTGAGGGLGKAHALEFARRGAKVVVNDLGGSGDGTGASDMADDVVEEIRASGGAAIVNKASVASREGAQSIVDDAVAAFGTIDILVNNAGILRDKSFKKMPMDKLRSYRLHQLIFRYLWQLRPSELRRRENGHARAHERACHRGGFKKRTGQYPGARCSNPSDQHHPGARSRSG